MEYKHTLQEISPEGQEFLKTLTVMEYSRHLLAQKMLGSSYFVEKTPQFRAWKKKRSELAPNLNKQSPATK